MSAFIEVTIDNRPLAIAARHVIAVAPIVGGGAAIRMLDEPALYLAAESYGTVMRWLLQGRHADDPKPAWLKEQQQ